MCVFIIKQFQPKEWESDPTNPRRVLTVQSKYSFRPSPTLTPEFNLPYIDYKVEKIPLYLNAVEPPIVFHISNYHVPCQSDKNKFCSPHMFIHCWFLFAQCFEIISSIRNLGNNYKLLI